MNIKLDEVEERLNAGQPLSVSEVVELLRSNLCHPNCACSDGSHCIQQIAADLIELRYVR